MAGFKWLSYPITKGYTKGIHDAIDIATPFHTEITAPFGGIVVEAGNTRWADGLTSGGIVGIRTNVPGKGNTEEYFLHLDELAPGLAPGQLVMSGQTIGLSGGQNAGGHWPTSPKYSSGPHTHWGFGAPYLRDPGVSFDPQPYVSQFVGKTVPDAPNYATPGEAAQNIADATFGPILAAVQGVKDTIVKTAVIAGGALLGTALIVGGVAVGGAQ